jgi:hypothetical protein
MHLSSPSYKPLAPPIAMSLAEDIISCGSQPARYLPGFYSKTNQMHQFLKFILFCSRTLHVSDGLSVHHQESKTVHTASGICQTDSADCLLEGTRCSISNTK